jgi:hypothetical protein
MNTTQITYNLKPSKSEIIQRLLEAKHINVGEAMTLMAADFMPMPTMPYNPPTPVPANPPYPGQHNPFWYNTPGTTSHTGNIDKTTVNSTF